MADVQANSGAARKRAKTDAGLGRDWPVSSCRLREKGPRNGATWSAPRERSFCSSGSDKNGTTVRSRPPAPRSPQPVSLASPSPTAVTPPTWPGPALAVLVATSTAVLPATSAVEGGQFERSCLVASGEASGSKRPRLPPQVSPQPTHPVRQYTAWHREVCGDVGVRLATPPHLRPLGATSRCLRSEERRVGKECRSRWSPYH